MQINAFFFTILLSILKIPQTKYDAICLLLRTCRKKDPCIARTLFKLMAS